jgi:hypothetical protein
MAIRGRGSSKSEDQKPAHLQEQLHVLVEYEGPTLMRDTTLSNAEMLVRAVLTPAAEGMPGQGHAVSQYDMLKQQMQQVRCRVQGVGCRVQGAGCRVQGAGCRVRGEADAEGKYAHQ